MVQSKEDGLVIHSAVLPLISPSWAIHDGRLYMGLLPQAVKVAVNKPKRSILDNPRFTALRQRLNAGKPITSISYVDLEATAPLTYQSYLMLMQTFPAAAVAFGSDSPIAMLPPLSQVMPHLGPAGGATWNDELGWHGHFSSPFPGSVALGQYALRGLLSSPTSIQSSCVDGGHHAARPRRVRTAARQMQSNTQARGIHQAQAIYAQSHKVGTGEGHYSNDIAESVATKPLQYRICHFAFRGQNHAG